MQKPLPMPSFYVTLFLPKKSTYIDVLVRMVGTQEFYPRIVLNNIMEALNISSAVLVFSAPIPKLDVGSNVDYDMTIDIKEHLKANGGTYDN